MVKCLEFTSERVIKVICVLESTIWAEIAQITSIESARTARIGEISNMLFF